MPKVFDGFTVVELADRRNQFVGKLMSDAGARVIQIEPVTGSAGRWTGPFVDDREDPDGCLDYWWYNTGKESACIDITRKPGQDLLRKLLATADVFVESTRPGTLHDYGLDYESISSSNSGLIYASLTDFGQDGPWTGLEMNDHAHLALGGQMGSSGYADPHETPIGGHGRQAYNLASVMMLHTITVGIYERLLSGLGQYLDVAIHDCCAICTGHDIPAWLSYDEPWLRQAGQAAAASYRPSRQVACADGRYLQFSTGEINSRAWAKLVEWMTEVGVAGELASPEWQDERYRAEQTRTGSGMQDGVARLLAKVTAEEAFVRGQTIGLAWAVVSGPEENVDLSHYNKRGFFVPVEHPEIGKTIPYPRGFYGSAELGARPERRAPHLGEHTSAILRGDLGLAEADVEALKQVGVVR